MKIKIVKSKTDRKLSAVSASGIKSSIRNHAPPPKFLPGTVSTLSGSLSYQIKDQDGILVHRHANQMKPTGIQPSDSDSETSSSAYDADEESNTGSETLNPAPILTPTAVLPPEEIDTGSVSEGNPPTKLTLSPRLATSVIGKHVRIKTYICIG